MSKKDVISFKDAAQFYRETTGKQVSASYIATMMHQFRHLGHFALSPKSVMPQLVGVKKHPFEYFVRMRYLLNNRSPKAIFHQHDL